MSVRPDVIRGAAEVEETARGLRPHRLPGWVRRQFPDGQLLAMEAQTSGVRLVARTSATQLTLTTHPTRMAFRDVPRARGRVDLLVDGVRVAVDELAGGDLVEFDVAAGDTAFVPGEAHVSAFDLPAGDKVVEMWLPHNEAVDLVDLAADAALEPVVADRPLWVHHGSSISHGSNTASPSETWPAVAARLGGVELRNLGLGGSALVDPFMARVIRDTPADLISVKLGINVVNLDGMRRRTFVPAVHGFLDTIRDGHPTTPLVLVSPIFCATHEDTPGPGAFDPTAPAGTVRFVASGEPGDTALGRLTLQVVRDALREVVAARSDDPHLHLLDGLDLYGAEDAERLPLPDGLHPDAETHRMIGERFAAAVLDANSRLAVS